MWRGSESNPDAAAVLKCDCCYPAFCTEKDLGLIISATVILYLFKQDDSNSCLNMYILKKKERFERAVATMFKSFSRFCRYKVLHQKTVSSKHTNTVCRGHRSRLCHEIVSPCSEYCFLLLPCSKDLLQLYLIHF